MEANRDEEAVPRDHFSPVQVRFPVNAPALRPPLESARGGGDDEEEGNNMHGLSKE